MPYKDLAVRKAKQKEYSQAWYKRNSTAQKLKSSNSKKLMKQKWRNYKATLACLHCEAKHPAIIDFHHVVKDPANLSVNLLTKDGKYEKAFKEIEKCIPLCANCHRIFHWKQHQKEKSIDTALQPE
jgi:hypothetical protein